MVDGDIKLGGLDKGTGSNFGEIIAVKGDIEDTASDTGVAVLFEGGGEALGDDFAAGADADDVEWLVLGECSDDAFDQMIDDPPDISFVVIVSHFMREGI